MVFKFSDEGQCPSEPSEFAGRKTNRLKRKDLRSAFVSKSQVFVSCSVPKGYAVIVARTIMLKRTCTERFMVALIDYSLMTNIFVKSGAADSTLIAPL